MDYNFVKDIFKPVTDNLKSDNTALEPFIVERENSFILKHNIFALSELLKFLSSSDNIFILNGFMGSGKTYVADCFLDFISEDVLIFKNSYLEAINLDDILLSMFKDFSVYHNEKKILLPKVDTNIFSEKINSYIKYCNYPMLFIFDSFEINTRSKDSQKDILDFINYLSHFEKIKIVICSRTFTKDDFASDNSIDSYSLSSLEKDEVYEYLSINAISGSNYDIEELYKATRGHFLLLELSVMIMDLLNMSLLVFSSEYKKSAKNFLEFLISKIISVTSEKYVKLLNFLSLIRHGVSSDFLINNNFANDDDVKFLLQKHIISEKFGQYYMKDYVRNEYIKSVSSETKIKIHEYLVSLYDAELPLKPFDRELFLSRQTMRQEIAYHQKRIDNLNFDLSKSGRTKITDMQDFNYLSYSKVSGYDSGMENTKKQKRYIKNIIKNTPAEKRRRFELSKEDSLLLNASISSDIIDNQFKEITDINQSETEYTQKSNKKQNNAEFFVPDCLDDYLEIAQNYEDAYNFSSAILYYKKALTYNDDALYKRKEPIIYTKLAICYKRVQDTDEAVKMYEKVYKLYLEEDNEKANSILLCIAQIYNEIYKFDKAKETYNRILFSPHGVSPQMTVRVYLDLSELSDNNLETENALKFVKKALSEAEKLSDLSLLTECYFKYALLLDDSGNLDLAQKYYLRCVQSSSNPDENLFLSSAYSNLAGLSLDNNNVSAAKMYYELSVNIDKQLNNYEGLFYSYSKLANLYKDDNPQKRYELLIKALSAAKRFDDITYAISVYIEIGDYYYDVEDYKRALKSYILAKTLAPKHSSEELNNKIDSRINKVKMLLGEVEFIRLRNDIKKKR